MHLCQLASCAVDGWVILAGGLLGDSFLEEGPSQEKGQKGVVVHRRSIFKTQATASGVLFNLASSADNAELLKLSA